jgi:hypothetical protein
MLPLLFIAWKMIKCCFDNRESVRKGVRVKLNRAWDSGMNKPSLKVDGGILGQILETRKNI